MEPPYTRELKIALLAVQRAAILTREVFQLTTKGTLSKADASPVTIGDFGAEALIIHALQHNFPDDQIVAEEEATALRENDDLRARVWNYARSTKLDEDESERLLGGQVSDVEKLLDVLDGGKALGGPKGRFWVLDPIDGTKGFVRGDQYAIALALIEDGDVKVAVLGCPNLPADNSADLHDLSTVVPKSSGILVSAVKGQGTTSRPLTTHSLAPGLSVSTRSSKDFSSAFLLESISSAAYSSLTFNHQISNQLALQNSNILAIDSQAKYACLASGMADIFLRLPEKKGYQECIWDHAAGDLILREAGGIVTDEDGKRLDFGIGRYLSANSGVVAAQAGIHGEVLRVVKAVLEEVRG